MTIDVEDVIHDDVIRSAFAVAKTTYLPVELARVQRSREDAKNYFKALFDDWEMIDFLFGLETGRFTYCENHQGKQRCRNANGNDAWHPGDKMIDR